MGLPEQRSGYPKEPLLNPTLVAQAARHAQEEGIDIHTLVKKDACAQAVSELHSGIEESDLDRLFPLANARLYNTLLKRGVMKVAPKKIEEYHGQGGEHVLVPTAAGLVENLDRGIREVVGAQLDGLEPVAYVYYCNRSGYAYARTGPGKGLSMQPHLDTELYYLHAAITLKGEANFYHSREGLHLHQGRINFTNEFAAEPVVTRVVPGALVMLRGNGWGAPRPPVAHALGVPLNESGVRISLTLGYEKPLER